MLQVWCDEGETSHFKKDCPQKTTSKDEEVIEIVIVIRSGASADLGLLESNHSTCDESVLTVSLEEEWIVGSAASKHMSPSKGGLQNLRSMKGMIFIGDKCT